MQQPSSHQLSPSPRAEFSPSSSNNLLHFTGQRIYKRDDLPSIFSLTIQLLKLAEILPVAQECFTSDVTILLPINLKHCKVSICSLPEFLNNPTSDTLVWTHHYNGTGKLQQQQYSRKTRQTQPLLDQLTNVQPVTSVLID